LENKNSGGVPHVLPQQAREGAVHDRQRPAELDQEDVQGFATSRFIYLRMTHVINIISRFYFIVKIFV
jgi:hypothetical protein